MRQSRLYEGINTKPAPGAEAASSSDRLFTGVKELRKFRSVRHTEVKGVEPMLKRLA